MLDRIGLECDCLTRSSSDCSPDSPSTPPSSELFTEVAFEMTLSGDEANSVDIVKGDI